MLYIKPNNLVSSILEQTFADSVVTESVKASNVPYLDTVQMVNDACMEAQTACFDLNHDMYMLESQVLDAYVAADGNDALMEGYLRPVQEGFVKEVYDKVAKFFSKIFDALSNAFSSAWKFILRIVHSVKTKIDTWLKKHKDDKAEGKAEEKKAVQMPAKQAAATPAAAPAAAAKSEPAAPAAAPAKGAVKPAAITTPNPQMAKVIKMFPIDNLVSLVNKLFNDMKDFLDVDINNKIGTRMIANIIEQKISFSQSDIDQSPVLDIEGLVKFDAASGNLKLAKDVETALWQKYNDKIEELNKFTINHWKTVLDVHEKTLNERANKIIDWFKQLKNLVNNATKGAEYKKRVDTYNQVGTINDGETESEEVKQFNANIKYNTNYINSTFKVVNSCMTAILKIWGTESKKVIDFLNKAK